MLAKGQHIECKLIWSSSLSNVDQNQQLNAALLPAAGMSVSPDLLKSVSSMMSSMSPEMMQSMMAMAGSSGAAAGGPAAPAGPSGQQSGPGECVLVPYQILYLLQNKMLCQHVV